MDVACSNRVVARDNFGRFVSELDAAALATMKDVAREGVELSRALAPVGHKPDSRTATLDESFGSDYGGNFAQWWNDARHALPQETGAVPHEITGDVSFFWEREGRMWHPGPNVINHPGNPARPYLRPAYEAIMSRIMSIARRHYPG